MSTISRGIYRFLFYDIYNYISSPKSHAGRNQLAFFDIDQIGKYGVEAIFPAKTMLCSVFPASSLFNAAHPGKQQSFLQEGTTGCGRIFFSYVCIIFFPSGHYRFSRQKTQMPGQTAKKLPVIYRIIIFNELH